MDTYQKLAQFQQLMTRARARHPAGALARIEHGFAVITGRAPADSVPRHPHQRSGFVLRDLEARAWHDAGALEQVRALERGWEAIRDEALRVRAEQSGFRVNNQDNAPHRGAWNISRIKSVGGISPAERARWPVTSAVLDSLPRLGKMAMVSALNPGCHITPHCGPWNANLTIHLPLVVPPGDCALRVGDEARRWEEGRCLVFDDSFEHEAWNRGGYTRMILLVDIWHPSLSEVEIELLQAFSDLMVTQGGFDEEAARREDARVRGRWWVERKIA